MKEDSKEILDDPIIKSNVRIFKYMNRKQEQSLVDWKIDLLLHDKKSTVLFYQNDWKKLMDVTDEIEKDELVSNVIVSSKGTEIKFEAGKEHNLFVKVGEGIDKKQACWRTIIKYLNKIEKLKA